MTHILANSVALSSDFYTETKLADKSFCVITYAEKSMRAPLQLAENIKSLLYVRRARQKDLAMWCRHTEVWLSAILKGKRDVQMKDLDRIAEFFGMAVYQLFQPGISRASERRVGERRTGKERRLTLELRPSGDNLSRAITPADLSGVPGHDDRPVSSAGELSPATKSLIEAAVREYTANAATASSKAAKTRSGKARLR